MKPLGEADWDALRWTRADAPGLLYHLRDGAGSEHLLARLRWGHGGAFVEAAEERWTLRHRGVWVQHVLVDPDAAGMADAIPFTIARDWRHRWRFTGTDGATVRWRLAGLASPDWICEDEVGAQLLFIAAEGTEARPRREEWCDVRGHVQVAAAARVRPGVALTLPLTLAVGWYLLLQGRLLSQTRVESGGGSG